MCSQNELARYPIFHFCKKIKDFNAYCQIVNLSKGILIWGFLVKIINHTFDL